MEQDFVVSFRKTFLVKTIDVHNQNLTVHKNRSILQRVSLCFGGQ